MLRKLITKVKCGCCAYREQCHSELKQVPALNEIIKSLTYENEEYEKEVQRLQHERDTLLGLQWEKIPTPTESKITLLYAEQRTKIEEAFFHWCVEKGVADTSENMLLFLSFKGYLDVGQITKEIK